MSFKILVYDRNYDSFQLTDNADNPIDNPIDNPVDKFDPIKHKLLHEDTFDYDAGVIIRNSKTRDNPNIAGVLVLEGNKRYGKYKSKFLYKCIPDNRSLPIFMIPYSVRLGFNKRLYNKYVVFKFNHWDLKHPRGTLVQTFGDVTELSNFYEYQLYCKNLNASIKDFNRATHRALRSKTEFIDHIQATYDVENRRDWDVISIDPHSSKDFDDAFGLRELDGDTQLLSIYIANVSFWIDTLDLWSVFSQRISTIYLPDRKIPMLPTILSDVLCSLHENEPRFAFTLDIVVSKGNIVSSSFKNTSICVRKNLRYETSEQREDVMYIETMKCIIEMNEKNSYLSNIDDSHDVIAYLMILMNHISATYLKEKNTGLFRSAKYNADFSTPDVPTNIQKFLKMWNSSGGQYVNHAASHDMLKLDAYVHITSPIRRLVDLLNIVTIQNSLGLMEMSGERLKFYNKWTESLDNINESMRSIRKVQNECALLKMSGDILKDVHKGFIFDKTVREDGSYKYMVYFPELKIVNGLVSKQDKMGEHLFKFYLFMDEIRLKQKIRIELKNETSI